MANIPKNAKPQSQRRSDTPEGSSPQVGIESTVRVCGGDARIAGTRIPVWVLEQSRRLGMTEAQLLDAYPSLTAADLVHAWEYTKSHLAEINREIADNEEA